MSGLCGFGDNPGVRHVPRPASRGLCPDLVSVPRLPERRSCAGSGDGQMVSCDGSGRGLVRSVPCKATVRAVSGRTSPALSSSATRSAARSLQAPPRRRHRVRRPAARHWGAVRRPCRRAADNGSGAPSRGAGKAAAFSRCALRSRRASVVSTVSASERVETTRESSRRRNCNALHKGGLRICNSAQGPLWANNAKQRGVQNG